MSAALAAAKSALPPRTRLQQRAAYNAAGKAHAALPRVNHPRFLGGRGRGGASAWLDQLPLWADVGCAIGQLYLNWVHELARGDTPQAVLEAVSVVLAAVRAAGSSIYDGFDIEVALIEQANVAKAALQLELDAHAGESLAAAGHHRGFVSWHHAAPRSRSRAVWKPLALSS